MKAKGLGILSALTASVCCLGPLLLLLLGLGGLGLGAALGKYEGYFILGAALFLGIAWRNYRKEAKACASDHCEMPRRKATKVVLIFSTVVVFAFAVIHFGQAAVLGRLNHAIQCACP